MLQMRCGTESDNCVRWQQLTFAAMTRPILSLQRVWLMRLLYCLVEISLSFQVPNLDIWSKLPIIYLPTITHTLAPSAPTIVSVEATSSTSISVQWAASRKDGGSSITGYVVEYHVASDPESSFETQVVRHNVFSMTLDDLTPSTEYDVRVRGENAMGCSVPSATMRTKTDGELIV